MSDGNRSQRIEALIAQFFCVMALIGLVVLIYNLGRAYGYNGAQAQGYAAQYPSDTDKAIDACSMGGGDAAFRKCVSEAIASSHESQRSEYDLQAQRDMSQWAWWLLVVSIGQIPIGIIGLFYLVQSIRQGRQGIIKAREANEIAHRQLEMAQKPIVYVSCKGSLLPDPSESRRFEEGETERLICPAVRISIENLNDQVCFVERMLLAIDIANDRRWTEVFIGEIARKGHPFVCSTISYDTRIEREPDTISIQQLVFWFNAERRDQYRIVPPPLVGILVYSDAANNVWEHRFSFRGPTLWGAGFTRYGGKQRNFEKRQENRANHAALGGV